jgi:multidrug resistance efflux pump
VTSQADRFEIDLGGKGFRFVRGFLGLILLVAVVLLVAALVMGWIFGMNVTVEGNGLVEPVNRRWVKTSVDGIVQSILAKQGQVVEEHDTLVVLDTTEQLAELQKLQQDLDINRSRRLELKLGIAQETRVVTASLRNAEADLEQARMELVHVLAEQRLSSDGAPMFARMPLEELIPVQKSRSRLKKAMADVDLAKKRLGFVDRRNQELATLSKLGERLRQEFETVGRGVKRSTITAEIGGVVLTGDLHRRVGDRVLAGETILEIAQLQLWQAKLEIAEHDIPKVRPGQRALLYLKAFPHLEFKVFEGTVSHVPSAPAPVVNGESVAYPVRIGIKDPRVTDGISTYSLSPGMHVEGSIVVERDRIFGILWKKLLKASGKLEQKNDIHLLDAV